MNRVIKKISKSRDKCEVCKRIAMIRDGRNPHFVIELETGYVVLNDYQRYEGYTLFLCKKHVFELHQLTKEYSQKYLLEMRLVAEAVWKAFRPRKLNYELLGNSEPHLHWHIIPRYKDDPQKIHPIWSLDDKQRNDKKFRPTIREIEDLKIKLSLIFNKNKKLKD